VGFEPTVPVFERAKSVHALDRAATAIGLVPSENVNIRIYETIILPVVLYGVQTWFVALRDERRLRVFQNRVLRRIFRLMRAEIMES
jgi:hypothetical protein